MNKIKNFISFDLEFWYDSEFIRDKKRFAKGNDFVLEGIEKIMEILNAHNIKATFFVTGKVMEKYSRVIKKISEQGHEIASHSYNHTMLKKLGKKNFEKGLKLSRRLIKKITKKKPRGFRAPSWSISENEFWAYKILHRLGFKYSSSLFPVDMRLYGSSSFPVSPFNPVPGSDLTEVPVPPFEIAKLRIPFSGGIYFRLFPKNLISFFIEKMNKQNRGVILYFHPWEFCPEIPRIKTSLIGKIITYYGIKKNKKKLDYILSRFNFYPFKEVYSDN